MAAIEYTQNVQLPDLLTVTRKQELDMVKSLSVTYYAADASFQTGSQYAARQVTRASNVSQIQLPVVLSDAEAAKIADVLLYNEWQRREENAFTLGGKYAYLDPTDVITYNSTVLGLSMTIRIENVEYQPGSLAKLSGVPEDSAVYTSEATGASGPGTGQTIITIGDTNIELMDLPQLRDSDTDAGVYVAASGVAAGWTSGVLYKSFDGGATYNVSVFLGIGSVGVSTNALGDWDPALNIIDTVNSVNIALELGAAALASVTDEQMFSGANTFCLGNEVFQAANCVLQMDGSYTLSRLLRYRKSSENTQNGSHTSPERFAALNSPLSVRSTALSGDIGIARLYKGVTTGQTVSSVTPETFTGYGHALYPFSPVNIRGARDTSSNLVIRWFRRNRIDSEWRDLVDVPMSEATESYSIDILTAPGGSVVRTLTSVTPTVTYTAADQTTDFGSPQASVAVAIYQISATVGRGFPGAKSI